MSRRLLRAGPAGRDLFSGRPGAAGGPPRRDSLRALASAALASLVVACGPPGEAPGPATAAIDVRPEIRPGAAYGVQAVRKAYESADVNHVVVALLLVAGDAESAVSGPDGNPLRKDVAAAALGTPLRFGGLRPDTTYRIRAYAYTAAGTASADQISVNASSSADVVVVRDDRPALTTVPVQLLGDTFAGLASTSVTVTEGTVSSDPGGVTFAVASPTPDPT